MVDAGTAIEALQAMVDAGADPEKAVEAANDWLNSDNDAGTALEITSALIEAGVPPEEALAVGNGIIVTGAAVKDPVPTRVESGVPADPFGDSARFDFETRATSPYNAAVAIQLMQLFLNAGGKPEAAVVLGNALLAVGMSGHSGAPPVRDPSEVVRDFLDAGGTPGLAYALGVTLANEASRRGEIAASADRGGGTRTMSLTLGPVRPPPTTAEPLPRLGNVRVLGTGLLEGREVSGILAAAIAPNAQVQLSDGRVMSAREALREVLSGGWPAGATPPSAATPVAPARPALEPPTLPGGFQLAGGEEVWRLAQEFAVLYDLPLGLVVGLIAIESNGNPKAYDPLGDAYGLLQLQRQGGQGAGHRPDDLFDPRRNLEIGVPALAQAWKEHQIDLWAVLQWSGHPGVVQQMPPNIDRQELEAAWLDRPRTDLGGLSTVEFVHEVIRVLDGIDTKLPSRPQ